VRPAERCCGVSVFLVSAQRFACASFSNLGTGPIYIAGRLCDIAKNRAVVVVDLDKPAMYGERVDCRIINIVDARFSYCQHAHEGHVAWQETNLTIGGANNDLFGLSLKDDAFGRNELNVN